MRIFCLGFFVFLLLGNANAQNLNNKIGPFQNAEFAFEVKTIDEFIERFNNDQYTLIRQYMEEKFPKKKLTRLDLIRTLFNYDDPLWSKEDAL